ncbi:MAG: Na+/H+ antiporter NhaA [Oligoflexia bacterium]|nr:Na+/H+ antiporter NhaA [Oligoflexia bacterium]
MVVKRILDGSKKRIEKFIAIEASSGIVLLVCTAIAMLLANSPFSQEYFDFLHFNFASLSIHHWVNDALMTIFFFVVGMEIKKEIVAGELSEPKKAALPIFAAVGGMVVPALIYAFFNKQYPQIRGWGIPMATDIAFAIGVLSFFGKKVPLQLKVFLLALAIIDDLGAVLVIAFFYTNKIVGPYLGLAALGLSVMILLKRAGIKSYLTYTIVGVIIWFAVLKSGVHATISGVIIGLLTPLQFQKNKGDPASETYSPLIYLTHKLHPWVSFLIMPLFALSNAGVQLSEINLEMIFANSIFQGVFWGLLLGKPVGIFLASYISVKLSLARLPENSNYAHVWAIGFLGGIGFTMALFISNLALYPAQELYSKMGILLASFFAAHLGLLTIWLSTKRSSSASLEK